MREQEELCTDCFSYQCHFCGGEGVVRVRNKTRHVNLCAACDATVNSEHILKVVSDPEQYAEFLKTSYHARTYKNYRSGL